MEAVQIKRALANAKFHLWVMWRGFCRTVYGASVAGLVAMAIYGFISVSKGTGWTAVFDFVSACVNMAVALANMYLMGERKKDRKREYKPHRGG